VEPGNAHPLSIIHQLTHAILPGRKATAQLYPLVEAGGFALGRAAKTSALRNFFPSRLDDTFQISATASDRLLRQRAWKQPEALACSSELERGATVLVRGLSRYANC